MKRDPDDAAAFAADEARLSRPKTTLHFRAPGASTTGCGQEIFVGSGSIASTLERVTCSKCLELLEQGDLSKLTQYERVESCLIGLGARMQAVAGKLNKNGNGFLVAMFVLRNGKPVLAQRMKDGGVDVFLQASDEGTVSGLEAALHRYAETQ